MPPVTVKASALSFAAKVEGGKLLVQTEAGFLTPEEAGVTVETDTLMAGENQRLDVLQTISGASERWPVESGQVDYLLGMVGNAGDYLDRVDVFITEAAKSQIVLRDGITAPVLSATTHAATASTTTVINTAINAAAVTANQFRGCLMKVGSEYRRVLAHAAFAAGVVNQYTLDRALSAAPGLSAAIAIEDRRYVFELAPTNTLTSGTQFRVQYDSKQAGLRISTESGVYLAAFGDFT